MSKGPAGYCVALWSFYFFLFSLRKKSPNKPKTAAIRTNVFYRKKLTDKLISIFFRFFIILNSISLFLCMLYSTCNIILTIIKSTKTIIFIKIRIISKIERKSVNRYKLWLFAFFKQETIVRGFVQIKFFFSVTTKHVVQ